MAVKEVKTYCRICISNCGLIADVDGDQVLSVRGDREHPFTRGYTCSKGRSLHLMHHHPKRIERPQMRTNGELIDTTWDIALDDLGAKLRKIIAESGPRAVAVFTGNGGFLDGAAYLSIRNFNSKLGTPSVYSDMTIDSAPKLWISDLLCGIAGQSPRPDFEKTKLTIFVGSNPMVSHGHTFMVNVPSERIRQLKVNGEVWVLDPRRTETATRATRHLAPRPGTDYAIMAFLVREILRDGADREYLARHAQDVDRLTTTVEPFTIDRASAISGVPKGDLCDMLAAVRRAGRLAVENGTGVNMSRAGNLVAWLSWALMIVTGSLDREGGAWVNPGLLMQRDRLNRPPSAIGGAIGPGPESRPELHSLVGEYPCVALPDEIDAGHVRALISFGGNVVAALPGTDRLVAGLKKLEALATIEIIGNGTTAHATHVLPSKDQLERPDLPYLLDAFFPYLATQYTAPTVRAVGERRSFWWITSQIGKRLGLEVMPGIDIDAATDDDVLASITRGTRVSFDQLRTGEFYIHDEKPQIGWLQKYVDEKLGGWRVAPQELVDQLQTIEPPAELVLISHRQKKHMNSRLTDMETAKFILIGPEEAGRAGLKNGDRAIVQSDHGKLEGIVQIDASLPPGVLNVPHGWDDDFNVNLLTGTRDCDPFTGMAWLSGVPVSIRPAWQINASRPEPRAAAVMD